MFCSRVAREPRMKKVSRSEGRVNLRFFFYHEEHTLAGVARSTCWASRKHLLAEWNFDHIKKCVFSEKEELRVGGVGRGRRGDSLGRRGKKKKKRRRMRNSKRGAVPVISQLSGSCVITGAAGGEWRTNSGSGARCGPLIIRFELTSHPKALWALCLLQLTSHQRRPPEEFVLESHDTTRGDFGKKKSVFWDLFSGVCRFRARQTLRNWSKITSGQRHSIALLRLRNGFISTQPGF